MRLVWRSTPRRPRREGHSALRDQVRVPHPEEPREPASSGRLHASGTTCSRTLSKRSHLSSTSATTSSLRQSLLGKRTREHPPRQGRHLRRLPQRRATTVALHLREAGSSLPPVVALECEALQVQHGDGDRGVRWPLCCPPSMVGRNRRLRLDWALNHAGTVADQAGADDPDSAITKPQAQRE